MTPFEFNLILQFLVDRIAEDAIQEALAFVEVEELERMVKL